MHCQRLLCLALLIGLSSSTGCAQKKEQASQNDLSDLEPREKPSSIQVSDEPLEGFIPLPSEDELLALAKPGRYDPFSKAPSRSDVFPIRAIAPDLDADSVDPDIALFDGFTLSGIASVGNKTVALVSYDGQGGEIAVGDVGILTTMLLPPEWKLVNISQQKSSITLQNLKSRRKAFIDL